MKVKDNMKSLKEYLENLRRTYPISSTIGRINDIQEIKEFFGYIPTKYIDDIKNDNITSSMIIAEWLNNHNYELLENDLYKNYGQYIEEIDTYVVDNSDIQSLVIYFKSKEDILNFVKQEKQKKKLTTYNISNNEFLELLHYYNYNVSDIDISSYTIFVEPLYPIKTNISKYKKIFYHFTTNDRADIILDKGLRLKNSKNQDFPKRIYLYHTKKLDLQDKYLISFINRIVPKYIQERENGLCCLKIDLTELNYNVYKDSAMEEPEAVFVYNNIPAGCITKYNMI